MPTIYRDSDWLRQSYILPRKAIDAVDYQRRTNNQGFRKFSDTTLGGNAAINSVAQHCAFADINENRLHKVGRGMGRSYSRRIEDNATYIHIRAGVPAYNSLTGFFGNFYSSDASRLARTGRVDKIAYSIGRIAGFVVSIPFMPWIILGQTVKFLSQKPSTRYCYLKPTMPLYWSAVNTMVNHYAANRGITSGVDSRQFGEVPDSLSAQDVQERNRLLPDIFKANGSIDIYQVATRFQRLANRQRAKIQELEENAADQNDYFDKLQSYLDTGITESKNGTIDDYLSRYLGLRQSSPNPETTTSELAVDEESPEGQTKVVISNEPAEDMNDYFGIEGEADPGLSEFLTAELMDGSQFVTFKVNGAETSSESFSNSTKESGIASTINGASSGIRDKRFNFANGNLDDGIIGSTIGAVVGAATSLVGGFLDSLSLSGLASVAGNALVDIPKHYDSSTVDFPKMSYNIELRATYANDMSILTDLMIPTFMWIALAIPRSTGAHSYTFPFHCELYSKGRAQSRFCILESLEITRGAGNVGWRRDGLPLGIDISATFADLSSIMHMPLTPAFSPLDILDPGALGKLLTADDSSFSDYMSVLASVGLSDQIYGFRKLKRNWNRAVLDFNQWRSPANFANWLGGTTPAQLISAVYLGTDRP